MSHDYWWTPQLTIGDTINTEIAAILMARAFGPAARHVYIKPRPTARGIVAGGLAAIFVAVKILKAFKRS